MIELKRSKTRLSEATPLDLHSVEAKLHDESRLIQRCFDDNKDDDKGDDKKLKGQSKNEFKMFKIESRTLQDPRGKLKNTSRFKRKVDFKNQESSFQESRSRFKNQEKA